MQIIPISPASFAANCYLVSSDSHALIFDPGVSAESIIKSLRENGLTADAILLTHGHFDHMMSLDLLRETLSVPVLIHENDADFLADGEKNAYSFFFGTNRSFGAPDKTLKANEEIKIGSESLKVLHTPGHTAGSCCFLGDGILLTGDTLFACDVGRCDLYSGDDFSLQQSLRFMRSLDPSLTVYPGHGECARLGDALRAVSAYL